MLIYYAVKIADDYMDWDGAIATKSAFYNLFSGYTYNIRIRNLTAAFQKTAKFAVFADEEKALNYLQLHQCFGTVSTFAFYTYPIFKVSIETELDFDDKDFIELPKNKLTPLAGKLLQLDHKHFLNQNGSYFDLGKFFLSVAYPAKYTHPK